MVGEVSAVAGKVNSSSQHFALTSTETDRAVSEIALAIGEVAQGTERQVQVIESAKESVENTARAVADSAQKGARRRRPRSVRGRSRRSGIEAAAQATAAMQSVRNSTDAVNGAIQGLDAMNEQIGEIVVTITALAQQTNLLALNAAIEARAGGRPGTRVRGRRR